MTGDCATGDCGASDCMVGDCMAGDCTTGDSMAWDCMEDGLKKNYENLQAMVKAYCERTPTQVKQLKIKC